MGNCKLHEPYLGSLWPTWGWSADSSVSKAPSDVLKALVSAGQARVIVDAARFEGRVIYGGGFWGGLQLSLIIPADVIIPSIIVGHLYAAVMMSSCNLRPQSLLINIACCGLQFWDDTTYDIQDDKRHLRAWKVFITLKNVSPISTEWISSAHCHACIKSPNTFLMKNLKLFTTGAHLSSITLPCGDRPQHSVPVPILIIAHSITALW